MELSDIQELIRYTHQYKSCKEYQDNYEVIHGYAVITHLEDTQSELEDAKKLGFTDLSYLPRIGVKKYNADPSVVNRIKNIPDHVNTALCDDNYLIAKLGFDEILLVSSISSDGELIKSLNKDNKNIAGCEDQAVLVPRHDTHACFALTGSLTSELFAKICAVDLRLNKIKNLEVVQTNIARISAIIIRNDFNECPCFYILVDQSYVHYFWSCITELMEEFSGNIIGCHSFSLLR
ncbi:MAG: hypothetical protein AAGB35_02765 [Pseudomonadota bacterium]